MMIGAAPSRIGRYELVRPLGKNMTDVYLAIDTVEDRKAVVKLIRTGSPGSHLVMEAERRGAAIQKELQRIDPRMVEIYEIGDEDGYFFVAMQYVEGRNLAEVLRSENVIDPSRAAVIALEICEQLAKFHSWESTVVHGDIKPSNIHIGLNDTVRLLDFGIAKTLRPDCSDTAHQFGSPSYCSPERLIRSAVDQQSDLWAVGATLYEMLSGSPPYQAGSTRKLESLIRSKRPPRALPPAIPRPLNLIVTKALSPEPAQRYRSAVDFQADLQAFLEHKPTLAEMERRRGWNPNATIEAARECLRKATRTIARARKALRVAGAAGWFAAGMSLWVGGSLAWQQWQVKAASPPASPSKPIVNRLNPEPEVRVLYIRDAEAILDGFRASGDPSLNDFDWQKAEVYLERAVQLGADDDRTIGELALSKGYATLQRVEGGRYAAEAARRQGIYARDQFFIAAIHMPASPTPHQALARVYVYALPNIDRAFEQFAQAEKLGAALGRREIEQQGDAYRQQALSESPRQARADIAAARAAYERIRNYDQVEGHLQQLAALERPPRRYHRRRR
jgi:hypothetical protein